MNELDEEVKSRFKATFEAVAESFKRIFPLVFGGGKAKLELTEPNNPKPLYHRILFFELKYSLRSASPILV